MEKGEYKGRRVDLNRYAATFFNPYLFAKRVKAGFGCGATALALLTGTDPALVYNKNGGPSYPDKFMVGFLRVRGFSVLPLTWCVVSDAKGAISQEHVILLSQLFRKNEATWGVLFKGWYYHNFEIYDVDTLSFLNKPVLTAYLVSSPRWTLKKTGQAPSPRPCRVPRKSYYFADLRMRNQGGRSSQGQQE